MFFREISVFIVRIIRNTCIHCVHKMYGFLMLKQTYVQLPLCFSGPLRVRTNKTYYSWVRPSAAAVGQINFHGTWARDCALTHQEPNTNFRWEGRGNVDRNTESASGNPNRLRGVRYYTRLEMFVLYSFIAYNSSIYSCLRLLTTNLRHQIIQNQILPAGLHGC